MSDRDRDAAGRAHNARPRDGLGRLLPPGSAGVAPVPDDLRLDVAETLREAQRLLDARQPFQAHEVLESRWKACPPDERRYWQGLAQAAVALTHLRRGNVRGAQRIAERARTNLTGAAEQIDGFRVPTLAAGLDDQLSAIAAAHDTGLDLLPRPTEESP